MRFEAEITLISAPTVLLLLGSAGLYVASRAAVDALIRRPAPAETSRLPSPGRLALGHWVPVAAVAGLATAQGLSQVALGVVFGSAVASLSLAMGLVTYLAPPTTLPPSRRAWPFFLAGVMVPLLAGFSGQLSAVHALMMLVLGAVVWSVWQGSADGGGAADSLVVAFPAAGDPLGYAVPAQPATPTVLRAAQWLLAVALALLGAKVMLLGTVRAEAQSRFLPSTLVAGAILSPVLILPIIASGTDLAHRGRTDDAAAALVAFAMLNLFALLPMVIALWYLRSAAHGPISLPAIWERLEPIPMPIRVWRIDVVVLLIIGFAMIPVTMGRWVVGRLESVGLIVGYAGYLAASAFAVRV